MNIFKKARHKTASKLSGDLKEPSLYEAKIPDFVFPKDFALEDNFLPAEIGDTILFSSECQPVIDGFRSIGLKKTSPAKVEDTLLFSFKDPRVINSFSPPGFKKPSGNLLFKFNPSENTKFLDLMNPAEITSKSNFRKMVSKARITDALNSLFDLPGISGNLFSPLHVDELSGKNFADGAEKKTRSIFRQEIKNFERKARGMRKAYWKHKEKNTTTSQTQTIWDMIFPILQPPLDFSFAREIGIPNKPYSFQIKGIEKLMSNKSFLLADEMGTGKTVMSVLSLRMLFQQGKTSQALILCPLSALSVWDSHLSDWASDLSVTVVRGNREMRKADWANDAHVYLTTYDTLRNDSEEKTKLISEDRLKRINHVILDEAQYIKNYESRRSKAVKKLQSEWRWALTGTPIENRIEELFSIFSFLKPGYLVDDSFTVKEIRDRIEPFFLRRRKVDVIKELPPKIQQNEWMDLESEQRKIYDNIERTGRDNILKKGASVTRMHIFALMQKLKQVCNFIPGKLQGTKVDALIDHIEEIVDSGNKVLVFSQYREEGIDKLYKILEEYGVAKYEAKMSVGQRRQVEEEFKKDPNKPIFLSTVKTAGVAITLTEASYVIHFDHWWNPAVAWQAEDRTHRVGQKKAVNIYSYWVNDTFEERIFNILDRKGLLFKEVIDGLSDQDVENMMTMEDLLEIIGIQDKTAFKLEKKEKTLKPEIEDTLAKFKGLSVDDLENVLKDLLDKMGFKQVETVQKDANELILNTSRDTFGARENSIVWFKHFKDVLDVKHAEELLKKMEAFENIEKGFLITSSGVNDECQYFCDQQHNLSCIDGKNLANYIRQFGVVL